MAVSSLASRAASSSRLAATKAKATTTRSTSATRIRRSGGGEPIWFDHCPTAVSTERPASRESGTSPAYAARQTPHGSLRCPPRRSKLHAAPQGRSPFLRVGAPRRPAPVDGNHYARDERGLIRQQPRDDIRH